MASKNTKTWREKVYDPSLKKSPERKKRFRTSFGDRSRAVIRARHRTP